MRINPFNIIGIIKNIFISVNFLFKNIKWTDMSPIITQNNNIIKKNVLIWVLFLKGEIYERAENKTG